MKSREVFLNHLIRGMEKNGFRGPVLPAQVRNGASPVAAFSLIPPVYWIPRPDGRDSARSGLTGPLAPFFSIPQLSLFCFRRSERGLFSTAFPTTEGGVEGVSESVERNFAEPGRTDWGFQSIGRASGRAVMGASPSRTRFRETDERKPSTRPTAIGRQEKTNYRASGRNLLTL